MSLLELLQGWGVTTWLFFMIILIMTNCDLPDTEATKEFSDTVLSPKGLLVSLMICAGLSGILFGMFAIIFYVF